MICMVDERTGPPGSTWPAAGPSGPHPTAATPRWSGRFRTGELENRGVAGHAQCLVERGRFWRPMREQESTVRCATAGGDTVKEGRTAMQIDGRYVVRGMRALAERMGMARSGLGEWLARLPAAELARCRPKMHVYDVCELALAIARRLQAQLQTAGREQPGGERGSTAYWRREKLAAEARRQRVRAGLEEQTVVSREEHERELMARSAWIVGILNELVRRKRMKASERDELLARTYGVRDE